MSEPYPPGISDRERRERAAYHEAGHAVAGFALGFTVISVTTAAGTRKGVRTGGLTTCREGPWETGMELQHAENRALYAFAGDAAEMHSIGGRPEGEIFQHGPDYSWAFGGVAGLIPENRDRHVILDKMEDRARAFVREPLRWYQIQAIAVALLERHELTGEEAAEIFRRAAETFEPSA